MMSKRNYQLFSNERLNVKLKAPNYNNVHASDQWISGSVDVKPKSNSDLHSSYWPPGGDSCDGKKTNKKSQKQIPVLKTSERN